MFKNKTLLIILSFRSVILYQHVDDNYQHASYLNNKHPHMSRSLSLIFNLKVTCRLCSWKFLTTINHIWSIILSRGEKRSPLKWQYLLLFLGWSLLILSWRSAYVHKVYKILFCYIQNHSSHLFWWEKVCFTLKSVNNILFFKKIVFFDSCGKNLFFVH